MNESNVMNVEKKFLIRLFSKDTKQLTVHGIKPKDDFQCEHVFSYRLTLDKHAESKHLHPTSKVIWSNMGILWLKLNKIMQEIRFLKNM